MKDLSLTAQYGPSPAPVEVHRARAFSSRITVKYGPNAGFEDRMEVRG